MPTAETSLLVLHRRHSLQHSTPANPPTPPPPRYGHRHTRSEFPTDRPVVVKRWSPPGMPEEAAREAQEEEDDDFPELPNIEDFSFDGVLAGVGGKVKDAVGTVEDLCKHYRESVGAEVDGLVTAQAGLDRRMKEADQLALSTLKTTKSRRDKLEHETRGLRGGSAVDSLAEATETTHTTLSSIISTLLAIDEMLPAPDRLSPATSAHRRHYPTLHSLLATKATELNLCFNPAPAPSQTSRSSTPRLHRRLSSASQHLLGGYSDGRNIAPPPQLQLKTLLPTSERDSPKLVDSGGAYFPLAPQTATGVSLTAPFATKSRFGDELRDDGDDVRELPPLMRRNSSWVGVARRPSTSALGFFARDESAVEAAPTTTRHSWRGSGSWSGLGGLFGRRTTSSGGSGQQGQEKAQEKLKKLLETGTTKGKGKGRAVSGW